MSSTHDVCGAVRGALRQLLRLGAGLAHVCWPVDCVDALQMVQPLAVATFICRP